MYDGGQDTFNVCASVSWYKFEFQKTKEKVSMPKEIWIVMISLLLLRIGVRTYMLFRVTIKHLEKNIDVLRK